MAAQTVGAVIGICNLVVSLIGPSLNLRQSKDNRIQFTQRTCRDISNRLGLNVTVTCSPHKAKGYTDHQTCVYEGQTFHIYTAPRDRRMAVCNLGDGGFENWCHQGTFWVRWRAICHFHEHWNSTTMGNYGKKRPEADYPREHRAWLIS